MYVFRALARTAWFVALENLRRALDAADVGAAEVAYTSLYAALVETGAPNLKSATARDLCFLDSSLATSATLSKDVPAGLLEGARCDLAALLGLLERNWHEEVRRLTGARVPSLAELALPAGSEANALGLTQNDVEEVLATLLGHWREHGAGPLARYNAFRWTGETLQGIAHPAYADLSRLVGLARPLDQLLQNTDAFLAGKPAQHALLYGPRGSGKSTAVRGLLPRYAKRGLRLVELSASHLGDLLEVTEHLCARPHRFILFVDDLSFGPEDAGYAPLKTLLEGSLTARPANVLVYATSNRRHLVAERFSERPQPTDTAYDDVHAWDTQHERLALADRFGLTLTFPSMAQARYLEVVRTLAQRDGIGVDDLETRAVRFAEWGNGYSGRTAQQFVERLNAGLE